MYNSLFGLTRNPFDLTPDPACFISTAAHDEALAALYYGVRQHKGFIVVTGEVGTGKTLLLRCLLQLLEQSADIAYSYVFNSHMDTDDFLRYLISDYGIDTTGKSKSDLLLTFTAFLAARGAKGLTTVLIVDEAHDLSGAVLEEIRLLSNIETTKDKLLQILLVGQPELETKLDSMSLRQLKQRIALRARLAELNLTETKNYIAQRLMKAGAGPDCEPIFPVETIETIYRYSHGLPRLINTLCENGMISAYARHLPAVTPEMIHTVARDFRLTTHPDHDFLLPHSTTPEDSMESCEVTTLLEGGVSHERTR